MIDAYDFQVPVKIVFGAGILEDAGQHIKEYGSNAMIITTGTIFEDSGLVDRLQGILHKSGIKSVYFHEASPNPLSTEVDKGAELAKQEGCDVFIGLGGGSAMDAAKCIAYAVGHGEPIWPHWIGEKDLGNKTKPIIAITTTSGTASHVSPWAVLTNPETTEKPGNGNFSLFPKVGIVDPELMLTLPKQVTSFTTFDVFAHSLEGYVSNLANPITDMFCEKAMRIVGKYGPKVIQDENDLEARSMMAIADTMAGYSLSVAIVTLAHAVAHSIGAICNTSHGGALAALTPHTMRFSMEKRPEKFRNIGLFLRNEHTGRKDWSLQDSVNEVEIFRRAIEADVPLREQGVKESDFERIADDTLRVTVGNAELDARMATRDDIIGILKQAFLQ
jgi:alcohol dehydrogenase